MRLIISPAKRMRVNTDSLEPAGLPQFIEQAQELLDWMRSLDASQLKQVWGANDAICAQNIERLAYMDLHQGLTPAILAYDGIQYQTMAPSVFEDRQLAYVQEHLRILSGFYGSLRALDGVVPYRLEMQAKATAKGAHDLYGFWGRSIYDAVTEGDKTIVNLASKEYSACVERWLAPADTFITCVFGEIHNDRVVQKATYAKMARGEMVRYAAEIEASSPQDLLGFDRMGYAYDASRSDETTYVFVLHEKAAH